MKVKIWQILIFYKANWNPHLKYHWVVFTVQTKVESPAVILVYHRVDVERTTLQQYKQFWCIQS